MDFDRMQFCVLQNVDFMTENQCAYLKSGWKRKDNSLSETKISIDKTHVLGKET